MATLRVLTPPTGSQTAVNGRTYRFVPGTPQDIDDFDALVLVANGWTLVEKHGSGTTSVRPSNPVKNTRFFDATLNVSIIFDGQNWRNTITGAAV